MAEIPDRTTKDFFISYTSADREWAEWIAWQLLQDGHEVVIQSWDFRPGMNFIEQMNAALTECKATIAVLSSAYLRSSYGRAEWTASFLHGYSEQPRLLCVRVEDVEPPPLLRPWIYIDLVGLDADEARSALLSGIQRGPARPSIEPQFPGAAGARVPYRERPPFPGQPTEAWNLPTNRNPWFSGRTLLFNKLAQALGSPTSQPSVVALVGMGGVGKTALVIEYAHRRRDDYRWVWWVRAESSEVVLSDYAALAGPLGLRQPAIADETVVRAVRQHLENSSGWLLILDNARPAVDIRRFLPARGSGHVIITTRDPQWIQDAKLISVPPLTHEEAVSFLLDRTGHQDRERAEKLANTLGDLPLSLQQAAAYIEERGITFSQYLDLLEQQSSLNGEAIEPVGHKQTIWATWRIAIDAVAEQAQPAAKLLLLCAYLDPSAIPIRLFHEGASALPEPLHDLAENRGLLEENFRLLRQYSLVQIRGDTASINRIVCSILHEQASSEERRRWAAVALYLLHRCFPERSADLRNWPVCNELLPHALAATEQAQTLGIEPVPTARLLTRIAAHWRARGQLQQSRYTSQRAVAILESTVGTNNVDFASALTDLAAAERELGALHNAKMLAERAVSIAMSQADPRHEATAEALNENGLILVRLGEPTQARPMFERALSILQQLRGPAHSDVAHILSNVGLAYWELGDLDNARDRFLRARGILERSSGVDDPAFVPIVENIGTVLYQQGDLVGGRAHLEWALAARERLYGPDHPAVAGVLTNLGGVIGKLGEYEKACSMLERALQIEVSAHGYYSFDVISTMNNLGVILVDMGQPQRGKPVLQQALQIATALYGPNHEKLIHVLLSLGGAFLALDDDESARNCFARAEAIEKRAKGPWRRIGSQLKGWGSTP
jgi:tetratricopeptide (TPR) repeat protein